MILKAVLIALAASAAFGGWQTFRLAQAAEALARAESAEARARGALASCSARIANLMEDGASDAEIDRLPVDDLRNVPDHWLRPVAPR